MNVKPTSASSGTCNPVAVNAISVEAAATVAATLKALSDPLRLRMLSAIASDPRGESCVCDLSELADVAQPTVSHHLRVLKDVDVVSSERRGTWVWYRINPHRRAAITALLESFASATLAPDTVAAGGADVVEALPDVDAFMTRLADDLAREVPGLAHDVVLATVRESYTALARSTRMASELMPRTEHFARQRLADLARDRNASVPQVLFVCVANAGRSQLAAALVEQLAAGGIVARSAGSAPAADVHAHVRSVLADIEGDAATLRFPKPLTDDAVRAADVVITMGCGDVCPIIPGVRYDDWAVGDPALASHEGVEAIRDDIADRVRALVSDLLP